MAADWTQREVDLIVEDYFAMLVKDLLGQPYSKAEHNRALQALTGRSKGSIEFKHQNLSAAMKLMGQPVITGYLPAWNFQQALFDTVGRWLDRHPDWLPFPRWRTSSAVGEQGRAVGTGALLPDPPQLWFGPAPAQQNEPPPLAAETISRIGETYDVAGRDARNKALGDAGEELVLHHERTSLTDAGRDDLARQVRWTAREDGDGFGYDIRSFEPDGRDRLLEVKTTNGWNRTPFWITRNECAVADRHRDHWHLVRLWNFARRPEAFTLRPPLDAHLALTPTNFLAQLL
jgi:hypothetical protein